MAGLGTKLVYVVLLALAACVTPVQSAEVDTHEHKNSIAVEKCPAAVRKTIEREMGDGSLHDLSKTSTHGRVVYCADIVKGDKTVDVDVTAAGKVIESKAGVCHDDCGDSHDKPCHDDCGDSPGKACHDDCGDSHNKACHDDCSDSHHEDDD